MKKRKGEQDWVDKTISRNCVMLYSDACVDWRAGKIARSHTSLRPSYVRNPTQMARTHTRILRE